MFVPHVTYAAWTRIRTADLRRDKRGAYMHYQLLYEKEGFLKVQISQKDSQKHLRVRFFAKSCLNQ